MPELHAVILAAGKGTRMRSDLPKVLHQVADTPMLQFTINAARDAGASGVHVVYGHGGDSVREAIGDDDIQWALQEPQLGTGHAVSQALPGIPGDATVLVLYGDVPLVNPATLVQAVKIATAGDVGLITVTVDDPKGYGRIVRDAAGAVTGIVEEKDANDDQRAIREVNTGLMALPGARLRNWLEAVDNKNAQAEYYLTDVIGLAQTDGVSVKTVNPAALEETLGVNDRNQLAHLERWYQRRQAAALMTAGATLADPARLDVRGEVSTGKDVYIDVNVVLKGRVTLGDGVRIGANTVITNATLGAGTEILDNSVIEDAEVGKNCRVGPFARLRPGTRLADAARIGNFVETKAALIGPGSKVNHLSYVGDAEVGGDVNIGAGTITCNYDGANKHKTIIEDGVFVGSGVNLIAPVTVNADATIGAGSTITKDAPAGELTVARGRQITVKNWDRPKKKPKTV